MRSRAHAVSPSGRPGRGQGFGRGRQDFSRQPRHLRSGPCVTRTIARLGALLTPQGKILFDFLVFEAPQEIGGGYYLDVLKVFAPDLAKRLGFYKLRAKVTVEDLSDSACRRRRLGWRPQPDDEAGLVAEDPRLPALGWRAIVAAQDAAEFATGPGGRLPRPPHRARRAGGRARLPVRRRLPARGPDGPAPAGSISTRAAMSARRSSRACSTAAPPAPASCRPLYEGGFAAEPGARSRPARRRSARPAPAPKGRGLVMIRLDRAADALAAGRDDPGRRPRASPGEAGLGASTCRAPALVPARPAAAPGLARTGHDRRPDPASRRTRPAAGGPAPTRFYVAYHDTEWGVPEYDDRALFEKLILDGFQAGLSWITILRKRETFRRGLRGFEPAVIARFDAGAGRGADARRRHRAQPRQDRGDDRRRARLSRRSRSAAASRASCGTSSTGGRSRTTCESRGEVPTETEVSRSISKALKAEGFNFVGPTIVYAFMQAVGMVNDHLTGCFRHAECAALAAQAPPDGEGAAAPGSGCCRAAGSTSSIPRRSTSSSTTSPMASPASRAGTGRPVGAHIFSVAQHSPAGRGDRRPHRPGHRRASGASRCCCTMRRNT